jgi:hypothetical protein
MPRSTEHLCVCVCVCRKERVTTAPVGTAVNTIHPTKYIMYVLVLGASTVMSIFMTPYITHTTQLVKRLTKGTPLKASLEFASLITFIVASGLVCRNKKHSGGRMASRDAMAGLTDAATVADSAIPLSVAAKTTEGPLARIPATEAPSQHLDHRGSGDDGDGDDSPPMLSLAMKLLVFRLTAAAA